MKTLATDPVLVKAWLAALAGVPAPPAPPVRSRPARLRALALRRLLHHRHSRAGGNR